MYQLVSFIFGRGKGSGEQPIAFVFSHTQNLEMLLICADLNSQGLLIGENGAALIREGRINCLRTYDDMR